MTAAAAVAAHDERGDDDEEGQSQEDHQAHGVEDALVVLVRNKTPQLLEKVLNFVHFRVAKVWKRKV